MTTMYVYNGCQYPADKLPPGVSADGLPTLDEWFAENRTPRHKAISAPVADDKPAAKARRSK